MKEIGLLDDLFFVYGEKGFKYKHCRTPRMYTYIEVNFIKQQNFFSKFQNPCRRDKTKVNLVIAKQKI